MADDVTTRLQKEVARLESKMDGAVDQLKAEWRVELKKALENIRNEMGKMLEQMMLRVEETASGKHLEQWGYLKNQECPEFDGDNFLGWHLKVKLYFEAVGLPEEDKVPMVVIHLDGKALQWHQRFMKSRSKLKQVQWQEYIAEMRARFHDNEYSDPMFDLVSLKQSNTVEDYYDEFEALLNRPQLSEEYELSIFVSNLKPEISRYVRLFYPKTLTHAFNLAKQLEAIIYNMHRKPFTPAKIFSQCPNRTPYMPRYQLLKPFQNPNPRVQPGKKWKIGGEGGFVCGVIPSTLRNTNVCKSQLLMEESKGETQVFSDTVEDLTVKEGE